MSDRSIQNIFKSYQDYLQSTNQPLKNRKAIHSIAHCRTPMMGTSYFSCSEEHEVIEMDHSCRHRSCHLCASKKREEWVEKEKRRLLDVPHFHVVFTLPHEYQVLWRFNEKLFASLLFKASHETLTELMGDAKYHGVVPGILMALHTWGRQLTLHPHTHCLVTAGGIGADGAWKAIDKYLLPIRVVKLFFRGKMQALINSAYKDGSLVLPPDMDEAAYQRTFKQAYRKDWSVRIEDRYDHAKGVMLYLSRYLKGGPLKPSQLRKVGADEVIFRYKDHRDQRLKDLRLTPEAFLGRLLIHVPSMGQHTIRHYGLYASRCRAARGLSIPRLAMPDAKTNGDGLLLKRLLFYCKVCGGIAKRTHMSWPSYRNENSVIDRPSVTDFVQQRDQADNACEALVRGP